MELPQCLLVVRAEVEPGIEAAWNRWYDEVHLPEIAACPRARTPWWCSARSRRGWRRWPTIAAPAGSRAKARSASSGPGPDSRSARADAQAARGAAEATQEQVSPAAAPPNPPGQPAQVETHPARGLHGEQDPPPCLGATAPVRIPPDLAYGRAMPAGFERDLREFVIDAALLHDLSRCIGRGIAGAGGRPPHQRGSMGAAMPRASSTACAASSAMSSR